MGGWGPGNFDNDIASDHLADVMVGLLKQVQQTMADPGRMEPDEPDSMIALANLQLLRVLAAQGDANPFPTVSVVRAWKRRYLEVWDAHFAGWKDTSAERRLSHRRRRRGVITRTFHAIERLARPDPEPPEQKKKSPRRR